MDTVIKCPKCSTEIPLSDAFRQEITADILAAEHERHERELVAARTAAATAAADKVKQDFAAQEAALKAESREEKERSARLLKQLEEMTGEIRALRRKDEERELAYKQQLAAEEERIRAEARRSVTDEFSLKDREKDKRLADVLRQVEELKAKIKKDRSRPKAR